jgi:alkanesulfonate monooxygenase SsuD/methylene tetrahydromethanopterin reductase-like flavin-dependent oxidoreductase (luciferase family)
MGPNAIKRVATWGDGWMPIGLPPDGVREARTELVRLARQQGRDGSALSISVLTGAPPGLEAPALDTIPSREMLAAYASEGADRVVVSIPTLAAKDVLRHLDRIAAACP